MRRALLVVAAAVVALVGVAGPGGAVPEGPEYPSPEWFQREAENYAKTQEEPEAQVASPDFQARWNAQGTSNLATYLQRTADGTWPWNHRGNICAYWNEQCSGEPFLYPGTDPFYEERARSSSSRSTTRRERCYRDACGRLGARSLARSCPAW